MLAIILLTIHFADEKLAYDKLNYTSTAFFHFPEKHVASHDVSSATIPSFHLVFSIGYVHRRIKIHRRLSRRFRKEPARSSTAYVVRGHNRKR